MPLQDDFEPLLPSHDEYSRLIDDNDADDGQVEIVDRRSPPPKDEYQKVYLVFFLLGMGTLLPWNFFISLNTFWDYKFRNVSAAAAADNNQTGPEGEQSQTDLQKEFTSMLA